LNSASAAFVGTYFGRAFAADLMMCVHMRLAAIYGPWMALLQRSKLLRASHQATTVSLLVTTLC
jgi:hypothetical protein